MIDLVMLKSVTLLFVFYLSHLYLLFFHLVLTNQIYFKIAYYLPYCIMSYNFIFIGYFRIYNVVSSLIVIVHYLEYRNQSIIIFCLSPPTFCAIIVTHFTCYNYHNTLLLFLHSQLFSKDI